MVPHTLNWNGEGFRNGEDHGLYKSAMERVQHGESSSLCAFPLAGMPDRLGQRPGSVSDQSPTAGVSIPRTHKFVARQEPFEYTFADLTPGTYTLAARAVDDGGKSRTAEVTIRVGASRKQ